MGSDQIYFSNHQLVQLQIKESVRMLEQLINRSGAAVYVQMAYGSRFCPNACSSLPI